MLGQNCLRCILLQTEAATTTITKLVPFSMFLLPCSGCCHCPMPLYIYDILPKVHNCLHFIYKRKEKQNGNWSISLCHHHLCAACFSLFLLLHIFDFILLCFFDLLPRERQGLESLCVCSHVLACQKRLGS